MGYSTRLTYAPAQAERAKRLAQYPAFQSESGEPDLAKLQTQVDLDMETLRYLFHGELPADLAAEQAGNAEESWED